MEGVQRPETPLFPVFRRGYERGNRAKVPEKARNYWHFDKKKLHGNPDTLCIKIAVQLWLETVILIQCDRACDFPGKMWPK